MRNLEEHVFWKGTASAGQDEDFVEGHGFSRAVKMEF
jgi:hypothetical protein